MFDLLNIPLYHGWLVDPESPEVVAAVGSCSYNQLVEKIISQKNAKREELMTEGEFVMIKKTYFVHSSEDMAASQLSKETVANASANNN